MTREKQDDIFYQSEGDAWYRRNLSVVDSKDNRDSILQAIELFRIIPKRVLEVGCSNGYRLNLLKSHSAFKSNLEVVLGVEPSATAVEDGKKKFPGLDLRRGLAANLPLKSEEIGMFDLVILNFVFHWIDRQTLFRSASEVDRAVADKGILVIGDFYPKYPTKVRYHHTPDKDVWTYKQNYADLFLGSGLYELVGTFALSHSTHSFDASAEPNDRTVISILRKTMDDNYITKEKP